MKWRRIPEFPAYEISERGGLRKADTKYGITVRGRVVKLWQDGILHKALVTDLIKKTFAETAPEPAPDAGPLPETEPEPRLEPMLEPEPAPESEQDEWRALEYLPSLEINRCGEVRRIKDHYQMTLRTRPDGSAVPFVQIQQGKETRTASINVLLEETFGFGAARAAGYPAPDMKRALTKRRGYQPEQPGSPRSIRKQCNKYRRCHDCGRPTTDYRCASCWAKIRPAAAESYDPLNW